MRIVIRGYKLWNAKESDRVAQPINADCTVETGCLLDESPIAKPANHDPSVIMASPAPDPDSDPDPETEYPEPDPEPETEYPDPVWDPNPCGVADVIGVGSFKDF